MAPISLLRSNFPLSCNMPSSLKRSRPRELTLTRSFVSAVRSKICPPEAMFTGPREPMVVTSRDRFGSNASVAHRPYLLQVGHSIHTLPPEILAHVFVLGSQDPDLDSVMFPVTISHVCRTWRYLALRTPSLWRRISFSPGAREDMWRERMHRAKACSWDVELKLNRSQRRFDMHCVLWYMHLVTPHMYRWRSLSLSFPHHAPFLANAALASCCSTTSPIVHAPQLEELELVYPHNDDTKEFALFAGVAPRLRRVTLDGLRLVWLPSLYANLTYLEYTHHRFTRGWDAAAEVLGMLEVSNRLTELRVLFPSRTDDAQMPSSYRWTTRRVVVVLPFLAHFHLRVSGPSIPVELYHLTSHLSLPALRSLHLLDTARSSRPFAHLGTFLRSFLVSLPRPGSVVALRAENGWYDHEVVGWLMRLLPAIRQVVVKDPRAPERVFVDASRGTRRVKRS